MKLLLLILILVNLIVINSANSQSHNIIEIKIEVGAKKKISKVDVEAIDTALVISIKKRLSNFVFPKQRPKKGNYTARISYVVAKDGSLTDIQCINDPGYGMCAEAVRAIYKTSPWKAAIQGGREVRPFRR